MQLTEQDRKFLVKARKLDARWQKTRWVALAAAIAMIVIGIFQWPSFLEAAIVSGLGIAQLWTLPKLWKGRPGLKLLLKLAEENDLRSN